MAVRDAHWVWSELTWNLDQAHKMIGMGSDGRANVVTVPVYYCRREDQNSGWWYRHETAVGVMTWDLAGMTRRSGLEQQVLRSHGTVLHPNGQVRR